MPIKQQSILKQSLYPIALFLSYLIIYFLATESSLHNYVSNLVIRNIIQNGFNLDNIAWTSDGSATVPIWGYSWLLLLTEDLRILSLLQAIVMVFSFWHLCRFLKRENILGTQTLLLFQLLTLIPSWHAIHVIVGPKSFQISFFIIAFTLFCDTLLHLYKADAIHWRKIILSAVTFGLSLNFRSDFFFLFIGFFILLAILTRQKQTLYIAPVFIGISLIMLLPWGIYTKQISGQFLLTTSLKGTTCYMGLGNLPANPWGATFNDNDPQLHALIKKQFGDQGKKTIWRKEIDDYIWQQCKAFIQQHPDAYLKKMHHVWEQMRHHGIYIGSYQTPLPYLKITQPLYQQAQKKFHQYTYKLHSHQRKAWIDIWPHLAQWNGQIIHRTEFKQKLASLSTKISPAQQAQLLRHFSLGLVSWLKLFSQEEITTAKIGYMLKSIFHELRLMDRAITAITTFMLLLAPLLFIFYAIITITKKAYHDTLIVILVASTILYQMLLNMVVIYNSRYTAAIYPMIILLVPLLIHHATRHGKTIVTWFKQRT
ncbi:hypothetical protein ACQZV8_12910 [Magnetococcales bacterium HHB-1]